MTLLDRVHGLANRLGLAPAVFDPLVLAVLAVATSAIITGGFDWTELRAAAAGVVLGLFAATGPSLIVHVHRFATDLGVSPKVFDPLVLALAATVASWIVTGSLDWSEVKLAGAAVLAALVGGAAPPAADVTQAELTAKSWRRRLAHSRKR